MAKRKPIKLNLGVNKQLAKIFGCSRITVWRACNWNADTPMENKIRQYIFDNKLRKRF